MADGTVVNGAATPLDRDIAAEVESGAGALLPVEVKDVTLARGGKRLLDQLSFALFPGRRTALMGPNGAGKSLSLRILAGLIEPDAGSVLFAGRPLDAARRRRVSLVFQRPVLLRRSVRANLDHALRAYGVPRAERPEKIDRLLEAAGLQDLHRRPARVLSGGEQQRLALVRALGAEPQLLLLDEPTASLDPQATHAIERLIGAAAQEGVRILMVTHDLGQAKRMADEVVFLNRGRALERTPAPDFFSKPETKEAAAFLEGRLLI